MKLTKKLEAEIRNLYEVYWNSYINGDLETYASLLDEEFKFITVAVDVMAACRIRAHGRMRHFCFEKFTY